MISTFPYYGGRFYQLKEIMGVLEKHKGQFNVVVDVFGGSGKVLIKHDSSVTTGPSADKLETQYISKMEWWGDRVLEDIVKREAAELVFSDLLQPVLVSRGNHRKDSRELFGNKSFYESMRNLKEKPSGVLILLTAEERIQKLEDRIAYLEEQMNTKR